MTEGDAEQHNVRRINEKGMLFLVIYPKTEQNVDKHLAEIQYYEKKKKIHVTMHEQ